MREWNIGDRVIDEDGYIGTVGIVYDDGDIVTLPGGNCAAHPNPVSLEEYREHHPDKGTL